jgi:hypothetical protein
LFQDWNAFAGSHVRWQSRSLAVTFADSQLQKELKTVVKVKWNSGWIAFGRLIGGGALAGCLTMFVAGCGGGDGRLTVHPVEGVITRGGKPLANALVALHPKAKPASGESIAPNGQTDENGVFKVSTYDANDGAPEGEYAVTVQYYQPVKTANGIEPGPNVLPAKLSQPSTTDITVKIVAGANKLSPIEVAGNAGKR